MFADAATSRVTAASRSFRNADPRAHLVGFRAHWTGVEVLRQLRGVGPRKRGVETTTYRLRARLTAFQLEADSDIHLVLADPATGGTMIADSQAPACPKEGCPVRRL
jgi:hypothetical protein